MNILLYLAFFIFDLTFGLDNSPVSSSGRAERFKKWKEFKNHYGKSYDDEDVEQYRMTAFINNFMKMQEHNARYEQGEVSYKKGINRFADMSAKEFLSASSCMNMNVSSVNVNIFKGNNSRAMPKYFDWRDRGAVTPVKNQGSCGGCWAFASVAALETPYYLKSNQLVDLSPQNLIDCVDEVNGCNGGLMGPALEYVKKKGINSEYDYGYEERDNACRFKKRLAIPTIKDYQVYTELSEKQMRKLVLRGPLAVGVGVNSNFQLYREGIFTDCTQELTHAVTIVGFGTNSKGQDYWIIKNSWGTDWGQDGYMLHTRGNDNCKLNSYVSIAQF